MPRCVFSIELNSISMKLNPTCSRLYHGPWSKHGGVCSNSRLLETAGCWLRLQLHLTGGLVRSSRTDRRTHFPYVPPDHPSVSADVPALSPSLVGPANAKGKPRERWTQRSSKRKSNGLWHHKTKTETPFSSIKSICFRFLKDPKSFAVIGLPGLPSHATIL